MKIMCAHCGTTNNMPREGKVYCGVCLHRCDAPGEPCDCPWCTSPMLPEIPGPPADFELPPLPSPAFALEHDTGLSVIKLTAGEGGLRVEVDDYTDDGRRYGVAFTSEDTMNLTLAMFRNLPPAERAAVLASIWEPK